MGTPSQSNESSYCTFRVHEFLYGVEVHRVQEVLRGQSATRVPLSPSFVRGLVNLRGRIVNAFDLRLTLGLPPAVAEPMQSETREMNVVIRCDSGPICLIVDEIGDVVQVDHESYEPLPATVSDRQQILLDGAHKLDDQLLLILDVDAVAQFAA